MSLDLQTTLSGIFVYVEELSVKVAAACDALQCDERYNDSVIAAEWHAGRRASVFAMYEKMDEFLLNMMLNIRALRNKIRPAFHPTEIEVLTALLPTRLHAEYFLETMLSFEALRAQVLHCFDINRSVIHSKNSGIHNRILSEIYCITSSLRTTRNAAQPFNRMPVVILCKIFTFLSDEVCSRQEYDYYFPMYRWTRVTRVCRYWRDAAIGSNCLWTEIDTRRFAATKIFLQRSGQSALNVQIWGGTHRLIKGLDENFKRLRGISIYNKLETDTWNKLCKVLAPDLKQLSLSTEDDISTKILFHTDTLCLDRLHISNICCWPANKFTGLTEFNLNFEVDIHLPAFWSLLKGCPLLQSLDLQGLGIELHIIRPPISQQTLAVADYQSIPLLHLRRLDIGGYEVTAVSQFLTLVKLPPTLCATFRGIRCPQTDPSIGHMFPPVDGSPIDMRGIHTLRVNVDHSILTLTCTSHINSFSIQAYGLEPSRFVRNSLDSFGEVCRPQELQVHKAGVEFFSQIVDLEITADVRKLELDVEVTSHLVEFFDRQFWNSDLAAAPRLETVHIHAAAGPKLFMLARELCRERAQVVCLPIRRLELIVWRWPAKIDEHFSPGWCGAYAKILKAYVDEVDIQFEESLQDSEDVGLD